MVKKQLQNIVIIRSFAILSVVLYHSYCPWLYAWNCFDCEIRPFYSFIFETVMVGRMPLFVAVSGYLFAHLFLDRGKYGNFTAFVKNKLIRLLLPAFVFLILSSITAHTNLLDAIFWEGDQWFLKMLFLSFITNWIVLKYCKGNFIFIILLFAIIMSFLPGIKFFCIDSYQKYYMFFLCGSILYKFRDKLKFMHSSIFCIVLISFFFFLCIVAAICYANDLNNYGDIIHTNMLLALIRVVLRILTIFVGFSVVDYYLSKNRNFSSNFLFTINSYSYGIYLIHLYIIGNIKDLGLYIPYQDFLSAYYLISPIVVFVIVLFMSVLCTKLLKMSKYTSWCIGG